MRRADVDDNREALELAVIELKDLGVAPSSIRRFVNSALKAEKGRDGIIATPWLRKWWRREDPS